MQSLNTRMLCCASFVLAAFLGFTGLTLDRAFRESALEAVRDRLQGQIYLLLGAAELDSGATLSLATPLAEPRFSSPASGLYAEIVNDAGDRAWVSDSTLAMKIPYPEVARSGVGRFETVHTATGEPLFAMSFGVVWESADGTEQKFVIRVSESAETFSRQVEEFRGALLTWFSLAAVVLLILQGLILHWGLAPLRRVAAEIAEIEHGRRERLSDDYPTELRGLTDNLNTLIAYGRDRLTRYRNALDDLAHSLKTPLAVLRGASDGQTTDAVRPVVQEQVARMQETIDYQLQRAAAAGHRPLSKPVPLRAIVEVLLRSLDKVYADKALRVELAIDEDVCFTGDRGDMTEILGNLLDNAYKWASRVIAVRATRREEGSDRLRVEIVIEDDGPGLSDDEFKRMIQRGVTAKSSQSGQGIGLAVVREIVEELYGGEFAIGESRYGGAALRFVI